MQTTDGAIQTHIMSTPAHSLAGVSPLPLSVSLTTSKEARYDQATFALGNVTLNFLGNLSDSNTTDKDKDEMVIYPYHHPKYGEVTMIFICILLGGMILAIILGNIFVITAIIVEKSLQGVSNYLVLSLAMTDLLVAVLVMPLSLINEISTNWFLGNVLCDMWISMDVLCCTASILHLVAIAFDRYWAVSNIDYIRSRNARQILFMVAIVWMVSVSISIPPLFGWRDESDGPEFHGQCLISQDHGYTIFSTVGAFYCPLLLMLIINFKIYRAARYRIRRKRFGNRNGHGQHNGMQAVHVPISVVNADASQRTNMRHSSGSDVSQDGVSMYMPSCTNANDVTRMDTESPLELAETTDALLSQDPSLQRMLNNTLTVPACTVNVAMARPGSGGVLSNNNVPKRAKRGADKERYRREKMEMRRERKAARVLGIITGAFVVCWLPFFILAVLLPMCGERCVIPDYVLSLFLWLGYFNSLINPIIYTIFNPSFRVAFRKIFFRRIRSKRLR
ncbi:5-hydroxytryptamine receptor [Elysia marginata]|uniref:5-hydroxytryptamine receptor n=1 Tax=Elysia marginata TaxID=1093978 RepID=A0AAV4GR56_9GAST|nr:5-hydroxytryptamine receptor [Elysia marginata]